ncbi:GNAT family N-acetyltransferase [Rhodococcoides fascians A25f]|uniref:GNAT family N-acetyltransferase n=1 Tax=Rhodococcoides fascians TaxID=1828 RepID=UPI00056D6A8D|nr:GNAT family N-acetyltransferase [Rhodococcus fascians]QII05323.1 GNAT family N-acetyltransferase [Rhodococcus fascians A25f]
MSNSLDYRVNFSVDDAELSQLHRRAFGGEYELTPWRARLDTHSKSWVGAFTNGQLCGFVHAVWDGGRHAFLLDTAVDPALQRRGIGTTLVARIVADLRGSGIEWVHVDYQPYLHEFYSAGCGFSATAAGLLRLE